MPWHLSPYFFYACDTCANGVVEAVTCDTCDYGVVKPVTYDTCADGVVEPVTAVAAGYIQ